MGIPFSMKHWISVAWSVLLISTSHAQLLKPGSNAPALDVRIWVKGTPIKNFEKGKTYVIEFWATWCGPCIENIPNLTKLAQTRKDLQVIGVGVFEPNDNQRVQKFVAEMGEKMNYHVAYSGDKDKMAKTWMGAAKQTGIPAAFLVKDQKVIWIGHPASLETVLSKVDKGEWDVEAAAARFQKRIDEAARMNRIEAEVEAIQKLYSSKKIEAANQRLNKLASDPEAKSRVDELRFERLAYDSPAEFKSKCQEMIEKEDAQRGLLAYFAYQHAIELPDLAKWLISETTKMGKRPDWYPFLNGARTFFRLKEYAPALEMVEKSRKCVLDYQRENPDAPKGNALDVLEKLESEIKKAKSGTLSR